MTIQNFSIYTGKGYEGDLCDSESGYIKQTGILLSGTLGFGKAVQRSGTDKGISVGSAEIGATSRTNVHGISLREYNHEAGTRPSTGTDFLYRAAESVSVLEQGFIYLKLTGATAITRGTALKVVEATGLFTNISTVDGVSTCLNVYAVEAAVTGEIFKARIDKTLRTS